MRETDYARYGEGLDETNVDRDPLKLFQRWLDDAKATGMHLPEAMTLATATPAGKPSARLVLFLRPPGAVETS
jgi:pyridoxamine 5'-phosphate oxidase